MAIRVPQSFPLKLITGRSAKKSTTYRPLLKARGTILRSDLAVVCLGSDGGVVEQGILRRKDMHDRRTTRFTCSERRTGATWVERKLPFFTGLMRRRNEWQPGRGTTAAGIVGHQSGAGAGSLTGRPGESTV